MRQMFTEKYVGLDPAQNHNRLVRDATFFGPQARGAEARIPQPTENPDLDCEHMLEIPRDLKCVLSSC